MANPDHLEILKQGVEAWNQWREDNPGVFPDLSGTIFRHANLSGADLSDADLSRAVLSRADLNGANLNGALLIEANLFKANLRWADLRGTDLAGTDLRGADLRRAWIGGTGVAVPARIREGVLKEFNHRCAICGIDRPPLHHIDEDPSNNDPENLLPLCLNCQAALRAPAPKFE